MGGGPGGYEPILEAKRRLYELQYEHWLQNELFTWQWWALLAMLIVPWVVWWRLVDRRRTASILCYGLVIMFLVITMDALGIVFEYWIYPIKLIPIIPHLVPIDWSMLPVWHMLIYQYFPRWRAFALAELAASVLLAFAGEPFAEWIGIYRVVNWYHHWSVPIYWAKALAGKWLVDEVLFRGRARR